LKEGKVANEVVVVSIGPKQCTETIRTALACGCDRGIHIQTDLRTDYLDLQPYSIAQIFRQVIQQEQPDLVLLGKQGIDSDCGQTGPLLAGMMNWPQVTFAANLSFLPDQNKFQVERETDNGTETIAINSLPAVVTCDLRLNEPRYATLPNIMKAKKKPIQVMSIEELGGDIDIGPQYKVLEVMEPPPRKAGIKVSSVDELIDKLRNEAKVLA
jgi:electron transfer flavoprotein beta subunit